MPTSISSIFIRYHHRLFVLFFIIPFAIPHTASRPLYSSTSYHPSQHPSRLNSVAPLALPPIAMLVHASVITALDPTTMLYIYKRIALYKDL